jgi:hypothetical protein
MNVPSSKGASPFTTLLQNSVEQPLTESVDNTADMINQRHSLAEAVNLFAPARTSDISDQASPMSESSTTVFSQLGAFLSTCQKSKRQCLSGSFDPNARMSDSEQASLLLEHISALVSQFQSIQQETSAPFTDHSSLDLDFQAMQSLIDKRFTTFDGISIDGIFNPDNPIAFAAASSKNNADILTHSQMLQADDSSEFIKSQVPEIQGLCQADVFEFLDMSQLPPRSRLLNAIWSYRRKRRADGALLKHKSRICVDGSRQQHGIDYWETYAPVVHWSTV